MTTKNKYLAGGSEALVVIVLYGVVNVAASVVEHVSAHGSALRASMVLVQWIVETAYVVWLFLSIRQADELEQRIQYEALAYAFAVTMVVVNACRYVERVGLPAVHWGAWTVPMLFVLWLGSYFVVARRYR